MNLKDAETSEVVLQLSLTNNLFDLLQIPLLQKVTGSA